MPDHAKKLGELAEYFKQCSCIELTTRGDQKYSERMRTVSKLLDALGPVVEAIESGGEMKTTPEGWTFGMKLKYADAKSLYAAVENLR